MGRQIKDYGKDVEAFMKTASDTANTRPMSLITTYKCLEANPQLRDLLYSSGPVASVGPYCVGTIEKHKK